MIKLSSGKMLINNYMIKTIKNDKLKDILIKRGEIFKEINKLNKEIVDLDTKRKKEAYKMDKLKDKTSGVIDKEDIKLEEFDVITQVYLEEGECKIEIINELEENTRPKTKEETEEIKKQLRERKKG